MSFQVPGAETSIRARRGARGIGLSAAGALSHTGLVAFLCLYLAVARAQNVSPQTQSEAKPVDRAARSVLLLPPRVEIYRSSVEMEQGQPAQRAEALPGASEEAAQILSSITAEVFEEAGVTVNRFEESFAANDSGAFARVQDAFRKIYERYDAHFMPPPGKPAASGDFSAPQEAGLLSNVARADAVVLIRAFGMSRSGGARALGAISSLSKGGKDDLEVHVAVVDGISGKLLSRMKANIGAKMLNDADQLHKVLAERMKDFPLLKQSRPAPSGR